MDSRRRVRINDQWTEHVSSVRSPFTIELEAVPISASWCAVINGVGILNSSNEDHTEGKSEGKAGSCETHPRVRRSGGVRALVNETPLSVAAMCELPNDDGRFECVRCCPESTRHPEPFRGPRWPIPAGPLRQVVFVLVYQERREQWWMSRSTAPTLLVDSRRWHRLCLATRLQTLERPTPHVRGWLSPSRFHQPTERSGRVKRLWLEVYAD